MQIDNEMLAFSREETVRLFNDVMKIRCTSEHRKTLYAKTGGWVTGLLLLAGHGPSGRGLSPANSAEIHEYFFRFIQEQQDLSPNDMMRLGLLDEIPFDMVREAFPGLLPGLAAFAGKKMFAATKKEGQGSTLILHELLRDSLRHLAHSQIARDDISETLNVAAEWYADHGHIEKALFCFARSENWPRMSQLLQDHGLGILFRNQHWTLVELFELVPPQALTMDPWLSFFAGEALYAVTPDRCFDLLDRARRLFFEQGQDRWELLTITSILLYFIIINGNFGRKKELVLRGDRLFKRVHAELEGTSELRALHALAMGSIYVLGDIPKTQAYNRQAVERLAAEGSGRSFHFMHTNLVLEPLFSGRVDHGLKMLDAHFSVSSYPSLSPTLQFSIELLYLFTLTLRGDFYIYEDQKKRLMKSCADISRRSYLGSYTMLFDCEQLVYEGKYHELLNHVQEREGDPNVSSSPHILSQFFQYKALALAMLGRHEEVWEPLKWSLKLRARVGGPHFGAKCRIVLGAALSMGPRVDLAEQFLTQGIKGSRKVGENHARVSAYAYRAAMFLRTKEFHKAHQDIGKMMELITRFKKTHCFIWDKQIMTSVLSEAVRQGIHPNVARFLAREQMFLDIRDDGRSIPVMLIHAVGPLWSGIPHTGKAFALRDLRPKPQQLFAILLQSPRGLRVDTLLDLLSETEGTSVSRNNLDTTLSRLRADFSRASGLNGRDYIEFAEGTIRLQNTVFDTQLMERHARKGMILWHQEQPWQANHEFATAFRLLRDSLRNLDRESRSNIDLPQDLLDLLTESAQAWGDFLVCTGKSEDALAITDLVLHCDLINDKLQVMRYELLNGLGRPAQAIKSLKSYQRTLQREGFQSEEIRLVLESTL